MTSPSAVQVRSTTFRISRRSSYRRGRWKRRSRTVLNPRRRPALATVGPAGRRDLARSVSINSIGLGSVTPLLGRDDVAVVRLTAVDDLHLRARRKVVDPPGEGLGRPEVRTVAVVTGA